MRNAAPDDQVETELKLQLDPEAETRLRQALARSPLREGSVRTRSLVSIYCDTPEDALARAGIALRLRKQGRGWVQTVKVLPEGGSRGFFAVREVEVPAPAGRLRLDIEDPSGVYEDVRARLDGAEVAPVFETRVKRSTARLRSDRGLVEVAIDRGEVVAGALSAPIREAELELLEGQVGAVFDAARALFGEGLVRLSAEQKSARGRRLARNGQADLPLAPCNAGTIAFPPDADMAQAAQAVLRDCFGQIAANLIVVAESDDPEGPHQLRVGLRRMRTALAAFGPSLEAEAGAALREEARWLGQVVGALRDLDVLIGEIVAGAVERGLDRDAAAALVAELEARRARARENMRESVTGPRAARFIFDLAEMIEARLWGPPDEEAERLARPFADLAPELLDKRYRKVAKRGRGLRALDAEGLHELRKELKKLRYTIELCAPLTPAKAQKPFLKRTKALQDAFGALNDAASSAELLGQPAIAGADPRAQWAAGWILGALAAEAALGRRKLERGWRRFEKGKPFWC